MAERYPQSARAPWAREWAQALDVFDENWTEAEQVLRELLTRARRAERGLGLRWKGELDGPVKSVEGRLAIRDGRLALFSLSAGPDHFTFLDDGKQSWFHGSQQASVARLKKCPAFPVPNIKLTEDPVTKQACFNWSWQPSPAPGAGRPVLFEISPSFAPFVVRTVRSWQHLRKTRERDAGGRELTVYHLESPSWQSAQPLTVEVVAGPDRGVREIRIAYRKADGRKSVWTISDVVVGEEVPPTALAVAVPKGVDVREADEVNPLQLVSQLLPLAGRLWEAATLKAKD
jgi:hypothetical protein